MARLTRLIVTAPAKDRFGRLDGALMSVGGTPSGTVASTTDEAWRSAFESVFLGASRLARVLATDLGNPDRRDAATGSVAGTGGSVVCVLASSVRVPLAELAISNGLFPGLAGCASARQISPPIECPNKADRLIFRWSSTATTSKAIVPSA